MTFEETKALRQALSAWALTLARRLYHKGTFRRWSSARRWYRTHQAGLALRWTFPDSPLS